MRQESEVLQRLEIVHREVDACQDGLELIMLNTVMAILMWVLGADIDPRIS